MKLNEGRKIKFNDFYLNKINYINEISGAAEKSSTP